MADVTKPADTPTGTYVPIPGGYAFVPAPLPRQITLDASVVYLLDQAAHRVGALSAVGETLPDPHVLIRPFMSREAVLSSRIEGTQTLVPDLLLYEGTGQRSDPAGDAAEVANYARALDHGLAALGRLPLSVRLFSEIHAILMEGVRGDEKRPGELRDAQVIVGRPGSTVRDAAYVPPPAHLVRDLLSDFEAFANAEIKIPPLVTCAMLHYQFETIHPYLDGNGRIGRLLIILYLCQKQVLPAPLLYLSAYFERNREEYYRQLNALHQTGDWDRWLTFFLTGVDEEARDAVRRSRTLLALHRAYRERLLRRRTSANALSLVEQLFATPYVTRGLVAEKLGVSHAGAKGIIERLCEAGVLERVPGYYPALFVARELVEVIQAAVAPETDAD
jgi:Fic family protein